MPEAWRLVKEYHAAFAFTGEGSAKAGGRWNSRGVRVVYASESRSLAAIETLVHLNPRLEFRYVLFRIQFPQSMIEELSTTALPQDWQAEPPSPSTKIIGDSWAREGRTAVWRVPSVLIPAESNFLLNPMHPDFKSIKISEPEPFAFDKRLLR